VLYKELLRKPELYKSLGGNKEKLNLLVSTLKQAVVFNIDNVSEYFFSVDEKDYWDIETDFPNLAPPFPLYWMEYKTPSVINVKGRIIEQDSPISRFGALIESKEIPMSTSEVDSCKWGTMISVFARVPYGVIFMFNQVLGIKPDGSVGKFKDKQANLIQMPQSLLSNAAQAGVDPTGVQNGVSPILLAISFLHCKNVTITQTGEVRRHKPRENREPAIKIHTLEIEPMKKVLKTEGQSETTGIKQALHICRGHFKDFRGGKGLFGKFKDIYWWDSQVRGSSKYGEVHKDYTVNPPSEE
jgi:hypothetical protein